MEMLDEENLCLKISRVQEATNFEYHGMVGVSVPVSYTIMTYMDFMIRILSTTEKNLRNL
jgi:hypothetical protein